MHRLQQRASAARLEDHSTFARGRATACAQEVDGAQLSVACVFFTQHTPKFGQHGINPDTGKCWCYNLYGESKCWGCQVSSA